MPESYLQLYQQGFLPGPKETKEAFFKRISLSRKIIASPEKYITEKSLKGSIFTPVDRAYILINNSKYSFFQASSTIILEIEKGVFFALIKSPSKFSSLFVNAEEVLSHEEVHARRAQFEEPKFEEILAYRTSLSRLRRLLSPVISTNKMVVTFYLSLLLIPFSFYPFLVLITWCSVTSFIRQRHIHRCLSYLKTISSTPEEILMAMTDFEIVHMSKGRLDKIDRFEFRWKFIEELFVDK